MTFICTFPEPVSVFPAAWNYFVALPCLHTHLQQVKPSPFTPHWCSLTPRSGVAFTQMCNKHDRKAWRFIRDRSRSAIMLHLYMGARGPAAVNAVIPFCPVRFHLLFSISIHSANISPLTIGSCLHFAVDSFIVEPSDSESRRTSPSAFYPSPPSLLCSRLHLGSPCLLATAGHCSRVSPPPPSLLVTASLRTLLLSYR